MTQALVHSPFVDLIDRVEAMIARIRQSTELALLNDNRATIDAARAWAKAQGRIDEVQVELFRLEAETLARIFQLGGIDELPQSKRQAARFLGQMTDDERERWCANVPRCNSVSGAVSAYAKFHTNDTRRTEGNSFGSNPKRAKHERRDYPEAAELIRRLLDDVDDGPVTVSDFADRVVAAMGGNLSKAYMEGVREMVRSAFRMANSEAFTKVDAPRVLTVRSDGGWVRVRTEDALVAHAVQNLELKAEQAAAMAHARDEFQSFVDRLMADSGGDLDAPILPILERWAGA